MAKRDIELKVGLFVFITLAILVIIVFSIGGFYFLEPGYRIKAVFGFVSGIEDGAPVRFAGVGVGEVKKITVSYDEEKGRQVELELWLREGVGIREGSEVYINTLGLLGEKYIEITPGPKAGKLLKEGDILIGTDPVPIEKLTEVHQVMSQLTRTMNSLNEVFGDRQTQASLKEAIKNSAEVTKNLRELINSANAILDTAKSGQGTVGKLLVDEELYRDLRDLVKDLKRRPWRLLGPGGLRGSRGTPEDSPVEGNRGYLFRRDNEK